MVRLIVCTAVMAIALAGGAGSAAAACKETCVKSCMGNDTPTERANCLAREKCYDLPACPTGGIVGGSSGMMLQPTSAPTTPTGPTKVLPRVYLDAVLNR